MERCWRGRKMKASVFYGSGKFKTTILEEAIINHDEIKIRNLAIGICGTDISIFQGAKGSAEVNPPIILGHEFAGQVVAVGSSVENIKVGDKVAIDPNIYCGHCHYCRMGIKQHCENLLAIGVNLDGGFAEYSVIPARQAFVLSENVDYEVGALAEPLACCIHGIDLAQIKSGSSVCIIGGGTIGQLMVQLARMAGASTVILSEPVEFRRQMALDNGADYAFDPFTHNLSDKRSSMDIVIECVGHISAVQQAFDMAARGATIVLFGVPKVEDEFPLNLYEVFSKELKITGSFINPDTQQRAVNLINENRLNLSPLITHRYDLEKVPEAIAKQMENDSMKVVVNP